MTEIVVEAHPLLSLGAFTTTFPAPIGTLSAPTAWAELLADRGEAPIERAEEVRKAVRDLLRHGGHKPTGRGKPASEYLVRAAGEGALGAINVAVDAGNVVSLHSGLPISVVDLACVRPPLRVRLGGEDERYVFNASGQEISVKGLLCLADADGPCANAVKDSQRSKTSPDTTRTLSLLWGPAGHTPRVEAALAWYRSLLAGIGAETWEVGVPRP